ncbi:hypothetical protein P692DRAFT_201294162 [Suillus brevipes Sb2]|nr:hypothetical protein P692DRAFT_201294162 [Suillus brevipes Sb2]
MWSSSLRLQCISISSGISPPPLVPSLSAYSGLFHFTWLLSIALFIFIIVSPLCLWWLDDDLLIRLKAQSMLKSPSPSAFRHVHRTRDTEHQLFESHHIVRHI